MNKKVCVFVAGPFTGDPLRNVARAVTTANTIAAMGARPFIPHLFAVWDFAYNHPYEFWMEQTLAWVERCDLLYRMPGESKGADREMKLAEDMGLGVYHDLGRLGGAITELEERFLLVEG